MIEKDFIELVTGRQQGAVRGARISGQVIIEDADIVLSDWSGCIFEAPVSITQCRVEGDLQLINVRVEGDFDVDGLEFREGGLIASGLLVLGDARLSGVNNSAAEIEVLMSKDNQPDSKQTFSGINLSRITVNGSLRIENCTTKYRSGEASHLVTERSPHPIALVLDFADIGGHIFVGAGCSKINSLFANFVRVKGHLVVSRYDRGRGDYIHLNELNCSGNVSLNMLDVTLQELQMRRATIGGNLKISSDQFSRRHNSCVEAIDLMGSRVGDTFYLANFKSNSVSLFHLSAKKMCVFILKIGEALDLRHADASIFLEVRNVEADSLSLDGATLADLVVLYVKVNSVVGRRVHFTGSAVFIGLHAQRLVLDRATSDGDLRFWGPEAMARGADKVDLSSLDQILQFGQFSVIGSISMENSQWKSIDFSGCFLVPNGQSDSKQMLRYPLVSLEGVEIIGKVKAWPETFRHSGAASVSSPIMKKSKIRSQTLLSINRASIKLLDLGTPPGGPIDFRNANIGSWGLERETADGYEEILSMGTTLDVGSYLRIENHLENIGESQEADRLHRLWRDRQTKSRTAGPMRVLGFLHGAVLGYGTQRLRLFVVMLSMAMLASAFVAFNFNDDIRVSSEFAATLNECGTTCLDRMPSHDLGIVNRIFATLEIVLKNWIPIVDLGMGGRWETVPGTWTATIMLSLRFFGWALWPILLTSLVSGLFPKRHRI